MTFTAEPGERHAARLLGLLHQDAGHVGDAAGRKVRRQLEHDLDGVARRQALVGVAAERPGHGELALRHLDVGADRELGRLARARATRSRSARSPSRRSACRSDRRDPPRRARPSAPPPPPAGRWAWPALLAAGLDPLLGLLRRRRRRGVARDLGRQARGTRDRARPCSATARPARRRRRRCRR